jgi:hypothetical protein
MKKEEEEEKPPESKARFVFLGHFLLTALSFSYSLFLDLLLFRMNSNLW